MVSHVDITKVEAGFIGLKKTKHDNNVTPCTYLCVKDLTKYIEEIISRDKAGFLDDANFNNKWWLNFSGDKGGDHMKYHVEVVNSLKAGSVKCPHIFYV